MAESGQRGESRAQSAVEAEETDDDNDEDEDDSEWDSEDEDVEDDAAAQQKSGKPNVAAATSRPRKQDTEWLPPRTFSVSMAPLIFTFSSSISIL
jgi:hypothetical protein